MFGDLFGGGRTAQQQRRPQKGADVETTATISFTDAIEGVTISLRLTCDAPCPDCSGTGGKPGTKPHICPECEGAGFVVVLRRRRVLDERDLPGLRRPAARLRRAVPDLPRQRPGHVRADDPGPDPRPASRTASGSGSAARARPARTAARPATSTSSSRSRPHRLFGRKGDNLTLDVPVSFDEAALGADIKVPTLGGAPVTLKIPAGTPNGRTFRVRGKGARKADGTYGDLLATVEVQVPAVLDQTARDAVEAYRDGDRRQAAARQPLRGALTVMSTPVRTQPGPDAAVYVISVAAELTGLHPQTLRTYERMGLITPGRTGGGGRRYSHRDIELLR